MQFGAMSDYKKQEEVLVDNTCKGSCLIKSLVSYLFFPGSLKDFIKIEDASKVLL